MGTAKVSIQRRRTRSIRKGLGDLPTSVQKHYFMLSDAERGVLEATADYAKGLWDAF
jgi:hypothetical protein